MEVNKGISVAFPADKIFQLLKLPNAELGAILRSDLQKKVGKAVEIAQSRSGRPWEYDSFSHEVLSYILKHYFTWYKDCESNEWTDRYVVGHHIKCLDDALFSFVTHMIDILRRHRDEEQGLESLKRLSGIINAFYRRLRREGGGDAGV